MSFQGPGAALGEVTPGSPAETAGLIRGDVVTKVDGVLMADSTALIVAIRANAPGDTIELTVLRNGESITVPLILVAAKN
jgi:putative serine protease PepD